MIINDTREIYSIQDCLDVIEDILEEELGLGFNLIQAISEMFAEGFESTNWNRFKHANCPGCVRSPSDCDIQGGGNCIGIWHKIKAGQIQACPIRAGGTTSFSHEDGFKNIDIADHKFNVIKPMEEKENEN